MSVRRLPGSPVVDLDVFWKDVVNESGWRIQYNSTFAATGRVMPFLKPFRLLDPNAMLWASADGAEELARELPELVVEFSKKDPLIDKKTLTRIMAATATTLLGLFVKDAFRER